MSVTTTVSDLIRGLEKYQEQYGDDAIGFWLFADPMAPPPVFLEPLVKYSLEPVAGESRRCALVLMPQKESAAWE